MKHYATDAGEEKNPMNSKVTRHTLAKWHQYKIQSENNAFVVKIKKLPGTNIFKSSWKVTRVTKVHLQLLNIPNMACHISFASH